MYMITTCRTGDVGEVLAGVPWDSTEEKTAPATGVEDRHPKAKAVLQKWPWGPGIYEPPLMTSGSL